MGKIGLLNARGFLIFKCIRKDQINQKSGAVWRLKDLIWLLVNVEYFGPEDTFVRQSGSWSKLVRCIYNTVYYNYLLQPTPGKM